MRPTDLRISRADPSRAQAILGWQARLDMPGLVRQMVIAAMDGSGI
jgi:GDPmannose 4,6-dehydratase